MTAPSLGVCYYPEHWPEAWWSEDAKRMAEIGIRFVRIGEFAWSRLEPAPGHLQFDWLLRAMDVLGDQGLKVIVGTPTATPPRWMLDKHPDMLAIDAEGRPRGFGSRRHYDFSHDGYREECRRIVSILAEKVGQHPALAGWQTDNEYGCHDTTYSYSPSALAGFRGWLRQRYGSIGALNTAWGTVFWSMEYSSFDQVGLPNLTVTEALPAQRMDFRRYSSNQVVSFNRLQVDILKAARPDLPVIHNFMGRFSEFDHFRVGADLDIASWDSYPIGFFERSDAPPETRALFFRQGDPDFQAFHHDLYRAVGRGRWWVMEQQPGPVNWARHNPDPLPGMARLWAWEAFAHGAEVVSYFRWRQAPFGQEQMHAGLNRPDREPAPAYFEARQVAEELAKTGIAGSTGRARVGLVYDYESEWAWQVQPHAHGFSHFESVRSAYTALRKRGLDIDILSPSTEDFSPYDLVLIPALFAWTEPLRRAVEGFEGHLLIGPRTGSRTLEFSLPARLAPDLPANLLDVTVTRIDSSAPQHQIPVKGGGFVRHWRERIETRADVLLEDEENFPVLVAQGRVHYLAASGDRALMQRIIDQLLEKAGLLPVPLPAGVRCRTRGGLRVYVNYGPAATTLTPAAGEIGYVLGSAELSAAGVSVAKLATDGLDR